MKDYNYVTDPFLRGYLQSVNESCVCNQTVLGIILEITKTALFYDYQNQDVDCQTIEKRHNAYEAACDYFGHREFVKTHQEIHNFWG